MQTAETELRRLLDIMAALRAPATGCPWDQVQTYATIAPYTIEEAYEVADAITRRDFTDLPDELGDLLFQVVFHARMAEEEGRFAFADVARSIADLAGIEAVRRIDVAEALAYRHRVPGRQI